MCQSDDGWIRPISEILFLYGTCHRIYQYCWQNESVLSWCQRSTWAVLNNFQLFQGPPDFPDSGRKYAVLEEKSLETIPIQLDDKYGQLQNFVAGFYNPKPIVDTIGEYEKYGNDGSRHKKVGTKLVNGYEAFSNIINAAAEVIINKAYI